MSRQCEILDTATTDLYPKEVEQSFTNTEGIIFFMDLSGGVYSFDPLGTKQMIQIHYPLQDLFS